MYAKTVAGQDDDVADLVTAARNGDADAWGQVVAKYSDMLQARIRCFRLNREDTQDVIQTTWLLALQNLQQLEQESRLGSWLTTIAKRECLKLMRRSKEICTDDLKIVERPDDNGAAPHRELAKAWLNQTLTELVEELSAPYQELFRALTVQSEPHYVDVARTLGRPIGSIGPSRARCFTKLRGLLEDRGVGADFLD